MMLFVAPKLEQSLYLGSDFFDAYQLWPSSISELNVSGSSNDDNSHSLSPEQQLTLNNIMRSFPSFEVRGLGRTTHLEHRIDTGSSEPVKQRHYPYSPAVQKLVFEEVNRM